VTRYGGTLPFDATTIQLQDGTTVTDSGGDINLRLNLHAEVTYNQLRILNEMRNGAGSLFIISPSYSGSATFDQFKYDRVPDANGRVTASGRREQTAIYTIQLQSREGSDGDN